MQAKSYANAPMLMKMTEVCKDRGRSKKSVDKNMYEWVDL
jgi:hypothetical protein